MESVDTMRYPKCTLRSHGLTASILTLMTASIIMSCLDSLLAQQGTDVELSGHWPLQDDAQDVSSSKLKSVASGIDFEGAAESLEKIRGASFDGRTSVVEAAPIDQLKLGKGPFSISLWTHTDEDLGDTLGDLVSCYDGDEN